MIRYDPTLVDLASNFFVFCTEVKVYLMNYSYWVELSMNIHERKGSVIILHSSFSMWMLLID